MSIQIYWYRYRQKYRPGTYISIGIGQTYIGLSLQTVVDPTYHVNFAVPKEMVPSDGFSTKPLKPGLNKEKVFKDTITAERKLGASDWCCLVDS